MPIRKLFLSSCYFFLFFCSAAHAGEIIVIARNGAGKELLENSLPAITLAAVRGVDVLELPVNATADGELILFQSQTLNDLSDVAEVFPLKQKPDAACYVGDLELAEIRQLRIRDPLQNDPYGLSFSIPTLRETLSLIRHLEIELERQIGISVEIVAPEFYMSRGTDISQLTIDTLISFGYLGKTGEKIFLQSTSSDELQRIHNTILPNRQVTFPLIQLVKAVITDRTGTDIFAQPLNYDWIFTNTGVRLLASYATAIALPQSLIFSPDGTLLLGSYLESLRKYGMKLLIYEKSQLTPLPAYAETLQALLHHYYTQAQIDGLYTDDFLAVAKSNSAIEEEEKRRAELPEFFSDLNLLPPKQNNNADSSVEKESYRDY